MSIPDKKKSSSLNPKKHIKRISSASRKNFLLRINPLFILVGLIGLFFLFFLFQTPNDTASKISIGSVLEGIEENNFSQIRIQDNSSIVAEEKYFFITGTEDFADDSIDVDTVSTEELIERLESVSILDRIRGSLGLESTSIENIFLAPDTVIALTEGNEALVVEIDGDSFLEELDERGLDQNTFLASFYDLSIFSKSIDEDSFENRVENEEFETVIGLNGISIGVRNISNISTYQVDWTPNYASFVGVLLDNEVNLNAENFEIVPVNIPGGIGLDDVLTVLTILGFIILAIVIFRSAQSSGMGVMQFGQSKARMFFGQKPDVTFKDVAGIDEAKEELSEIVDFLKNPGKYRKMGARIPKGILMFGAPGTGKTLLARAIAGEAGVPFFHTSGSEFEEMLVGAGASRVRDLFAKAKKAAPALIFIDEIDAVARKRGTRVQSGSTEQTLNQILVEMDGFEKNVNVIVIAATNRPDVLDKAILRPGRFDRQVRIEVPDKQGREEILSIHSENKPLDQTVDLSKVAARTVGFTGADLENIMNEAAIFAAKHGVKEISMANIDEAVSKVLLGPAKKSRRRTEKELKLVAYHEAGHALVAKYTDGSIPVDKISIVSRGISGGVTMFTPETDENIISKTRLIADIKVSLGGRAAEEVALDDISTGASSDIEKATRVAKNMIQKFGMSSTLGMVRYGNSQDSESLGYAYGDSRNFSEQTAEQIDTEVRDTINGLYADAVKLLKDKRKELDILAEVLLDKEVIDKEEFEEMFKDSK